MKFKFMNINRLIVPVFLCFALCFTSCQWFQPKYQQNSGQTMGTSYSIKYKYHNNLKAGIDSVLNAVNSSLSTYNSSSFISRFNKNELLHDTFNNQLRFPIKVIDKHFLNMLTLSQSIYKTTNGAFDPSAAALFNYYGFGEISENNEDTLNLDSLRKFIGLEKIILRNDSIIKNHPSISLNFNAIAKGYGLDMVAEYLKSQNIEDAMVEIGGELVCFGNNPEGKPWIIGVQKPEEYLGNEATAYFQLSQKAIATSGNYRNFRIIDGKKIVHIINPQSGKAEPTDLLSVSIIAQDCATADAYATACMVLGKTQAFQLINDLENIDAFFIYKDSNNDIKESSTPGCKPLQIKLP